MLVEQQGARVFPAVVRWKQREEVNLRLFVSYSKKADEVKNVVFVLNAAMPRRSRFVAAS